MIKKSKASSAIDYRADLPSISFCRGFSLGKNFLRDNKNSTELKNYGVGEQLYELNNGEPTFMVKNLFVYYL